MDVWQKGSSGQAAPLEVAPMADPRLQPTPDYGTLGPGSDIALTPFDSKRQSLGRPVDPRRPALVLAAGIGLLAALLAANLGRANGDLSNIFSSREPLPASAQDVRQLDRLKPQKQAEALLELAVGQRDGAVEQISSRVNRWQGKVRWTPQIATLTTAALNSSDMRVRESGIEVELAAYGLAKSSSSLDYVMRAAGSSDHARKIWALWALGLMGNRGVGTDRVVEVLTSHLKDQDEDSRRWAVEGLALTGASQTIEPLLQTMHDDPSPNLRERAACSLSESGMFTPQRRMTAVPQLLNYADDPSLDAQTHAWATQALTDITRQHFGNDTSAWRNWYSSTRSD
jgi:hypothetical protein